ncbi:MAG: hypothetical protein [Siphoviridae sp. ctjeG17]|nr:MAG: hypothetical protein [Siphoviridae sp. ctjeG17]
MNVEQALQNNLFSYTSEKTYVDKLLSRHEVERLKELVRQPQLNRSDILELLYMCLSTEAKLVKYTEWDRYVILKFFVWIREFIKIAELMYDYKEELEKKEKEHGIQITERTRRILSNNERMMEHNAKFLVDLYLNIARTSLSVNGSAFSDILKNRFEISYPHGTPYGNNQQQIEQPRRPLFSFGGGGKNNN